MSEKPVLLTQAQWDEQAIADETRRVREFTAKMRQLAEHYQVSVRARIQTQGNGSTATAVIVVEAKQ